LLGAKAVAAQHVDFDSVSRARTQSPGKEQDAFGARSATTQLASDSVALTLNPSKQPEVSPKPVESIASTSGFARAQHSSAGPDSAARVLQQGTTAREQEMQREKKVSALEKQLMLLNKEKQMLQSTVMKFPSNTAGRTIADRRQKREAEDRLEEVERTLSELRVSLRQVDGKR